MIRVKHCCCGCTLDVGARIIIWGDLIATIVIGLSVLANTAKAMYSDNYLWIISALIIPVKLLILVCAVIGVNKKKASYVHLYIIYNVLAVMTMGIFILAAIIQFDEIVDSDLMKPLMGDWEVAKSRYYREHHREKLNYMPEEDSSTQDVDMLMDSPETEHAVRSAILISAIIGGIINFFLWTYFNIVLYSYHKTLLEGGNFTNVDGVEYFAPTEQIGGKDVPGAIPQCNIPPSYFAAAPYPTQPVMPYSTAPPAYDEATGPNAYANPSFPPMKQ